MPRVASFKAGARELLSRKEVDHSALANVIPAKHSEVPESTATVDELTDAIPHQGLCEEEGPRETVYIIPTSEQLLCGLGRGICGQQASSCVRAVHDVKSAYDLC